MSTREGSTAASDSRVEGYVRRITFIAALGGFLFGYDTGVISGALLYIKPEFHLGNFGQQAIVASLLLGAVVGALASGPITDGLGRRRVPARRRGAVRNRGRRVGAVAERRDAGGGALRDRSRARRLLDGGAALSRRDESEGEAGRLVSTNQFLIVVGILIFYGVGYAL